MSLYQSSKTPQDPDQFVGASRGLHRDSSLDRGLSRCQAPAFELCGCGSKPMGSHFHFGVGPPIFVCFSGEWDVHWRYGLLTHGHMGSTT